MTENKEVQKKNSNNIAVNVMGILFMFFYMGIFPTISIMSIYNLVKERNKYNLLIFMNVLMSSFYGFGYLFWTNFMIVSYLIAYFWDNIINYYNFVNETRNLTKNMTEEKKKELSKEDLMKIEKLNNIMDTIEQIKKYINNLYDNLMKQINLKISEISKKYDLFVGSEYYVHYVTMKKYIDIVMVKLNNLLLSLLEMIKEIPIIKKYWISFNEYVEMFKENNKSMENDDLNDFNNFMQMQMNGMNGMNDIGGLNNLNQLEMNILNNLKQSNQKSNDKKKNSSSSSLNNSKHSANENKFNPNAFMNPNMFNINSQKDLDEFLKKMASGSFEQSTSQIKNKKK